MEVNPQGDSAETPRALIPLREALSKGDPDAPGVREQLAAEGLLPR